jgi:hypothetical protein
MDCKKGAFVHGRHLSGEGLLTIGGRKGQYFSVPPQFLQDWPESCRNPQDSAGLQAKVLVLVASPAKLGRVRQSLAGLGQSLAGLGQSLGGFLLNKSILGKIHLL